MYAISFSEGIEDAWSDVAQFVPKLVAALAILLVGWWGFDGVFVGVAAVVACGWLLTFSLREPRHANG